MEESVLYKQLYTYIRCVRDESEGSNEYYNSATQLKDEEENCDFEIAFDTDFIVYCYCC